MDAPRPLFDELIRVLRTRGFDVGVREQVQLHDLFERIPHAFAPDRVATLIGPVVAKTPEEQARFRALFDELFPALVGPTAASAMTSGPATESDEPLATRTVLPKRSTGRWLAAGSVVAAGMALWFVVPRIATEPLSLDPEGESVTTTTTTPDAPPDEAAAPEENTPPPTPPEAGPEEATLPTDGTPSDVTPLIPLPQGRQWIFLGLPFVGLGVLQWWGRRRRRAVLLAHSSKRPPLTWSAFGAEADASPFDGGAVRDAAHELRRREPGDLRQLDVFGSIRATIANLGLPTFRYRTPLRAPDYVALVQRTTREDHQAALFDRLLAELHAEELPFVRYFFHGHPRLCYADPSQPHESLEDLAGRFGSSRLLVFSSGDEFLDPVSGVLDRWAEQAVDWNRRALLTPTPVARWGAREVELAKHFVVVPASLEGARAVVELFDPDVLGSLGAWPANDSTPPALVPPLGQDSLDRLRHYLGPNCFRWLCACAVYPELQWDLTLRLGQLDAVGTNLVTEENLLRLVRIPWFRDGRIPDDARTPLIRALGDEGEHAVRAEIVRLLERNLAPADTIVGEEQRLHVATHRALAFWKDRKKRRAALKRLADFPPELLARDRVTAGLLSGRRTLLGVPLPELVRNALYRGGNPIYGLRAATQMSGAAVIALLVLASLPPVVLPPEPPPTLAEATPTPPPTQPDCSTFGNAYNLDGSCFDEPPRPLSDPLVPLAPDFGAVAPATLAVRVGADGTLLEIQPTQGSGNPVFDSIAQTFAGGIGYAPGLKDGAPVEAWAEIPFAGLVAGIDGQVLASIGGDGERVIAGNPGSGLAAGRPVGPITLRSSALGMMRAEEVRLDQLIVDTTLVEPVSWVSTNPTVLRVSADGATARGVGLGGATLTATTESGRTASVSVQVVDAVMSLTATTVAIPIGDSMTIGVRLNGEPQAADPQRFGFVTTDSSVVRVSPYGVLQAQSPGSAFVVVSGPTSSQRISVVVHRAVAAIASEPVKGETVLVPLGGGVPIIAVLVDQDLRQVEEAELEWSVSDATVAHYDPASGFAIGRRAGTTTLNAQPRSARTPASVASWTLRVVDVPVAFETDEIHLDALESVEPRVGFMIEGELVGVPEDLEWSFADSVVARLADNQVVALEWGSTMVSVRAPNGTVDEVAVRVFPTGEYAYSGRLDGSGRTGNISGRLHFSVTEEGLAVSQGTLINGGVQSCLGRWPLVEIGHGSKTFRCPAEPYALSITISLGENRSITGFGATVGTEVLESMEPILVQTDQCMATHPETGVCIQWGTRPGTRVSERTVVTNSAGPLELWKLQNGGRD